MKIKAKCVVAATIGITLFLGAGLLLAQQPKGVYKAVALQGIHFSKVPQSVQMARHRLSVDGFFVTADLSDQFWRWLPPGIRG